MALIDRSGPLILGLVAGSLAATTGLTAWQTAGVVVGVIVAYTWGKRDGRVQAARQPDVLAMDALTKVAQVVVAQHENATKDDIRNPSTLRWAIEENAKSAREALDKVGTK